VAGAEAEQARRGRHEVGVVGGLALGLRQRRGHREPRPQPPVQVVMIGTDGSSGSVTTDATSAEDPSVRKVVATPSSSSPVTDADWALSHAARTTTRGTDGSDSSS
jgi:hypothetical protein